MTWEGGRISERVTCLREDNPGPMTLDGTNTWVLLAPGSTEAIVVDPGEDDPPHQQRVADHVAGQGARVAHILITHGHHDHVDGAPLLAELTGAPVRSAAELRDGEVLSCQGLQVETIATPGHTGDSLSFLLPAEDALLTGDTVLGRGTSVVAHPDGVLADYLHSLGRLAQVCAERGVRRILPGHGPVLRDPPAVLEHYRRHRGERLDQVREAVAKGDRTADEVVARVYADVDRSVWTAARQSVLAQLKYLGIDESADPA